VTSWQWTWLSLFVVGALVEVLALINRSKGDTLSEQVWLILGVFPAKVCQVDGNALPCPVHRSNVPFIPPQSRRLPPAWVRVRRTLFLAFSAWLLVHLATGWI
jgi:hypothetical protein